MIIKRKFSTWIICYQKNVSIFTNILSHYYRRKMIWRKIFRKQFTRKTFFSFDAKNNKIRRSRQITFDFFRSSGRLYLNEFSHLISTFVFRVCRLIYMKWVDKYFHTLTLVFLIFKNCEDFPWNVFPLMENGNWISGQLDFYWAEGKFQFPGYCNFFRPFYVFIESVLIYGYVRVG